VTETRDSVGYGADRDERSPYASDRDERSPYADGHAEDAAGRARAIRRDPFSASWLQDSEPTSRPDDGRFSWLESTARTQAGEPRVPEPASSEPTGKPAAARAGIDMSRAAGVAAAGQARVSAERPVPTVTGLAASPSRNRRGNRGSALKLAAVIVLAALIGSLLVMMLR
jgi:hypothetical protein